VTAAHFDSVHPLGVLSGHSRGNGVGPVAGDPIYAGAQNKMRSDICGAAEDLVDIALPITNVYAGGVDSVSYSYWDENVGTRKSAETADPFCERKRDFS
jgi:hypothetical protein